MARDRKGRRGVGRGHRSGFCMIVTVKGDGGGHTDAWMYGCSYFNKDDDDELWMYVMECQVNHAGHETGW